MSLFEVPGWTVPGAPVAESTSNSRKRKRQSTSGGDTHHGAKLNNVVVNMEKLMAKLGAEKDESDTKRPHQKKKGNKGGGGKPTSGEQDKGTELGKTRNEQKIERKRDKVGEGHKSRVALPVKTSTEGFEGGVNKSRMKKQKREKQSAVDEEVKKPEEPRSPKKKAGAGEKGLTTLQASMKQSLDGARFRWINETLYKSDSVHAHEMMRENPAVFSEYHSGFRHQVQTWPDNPVKHYISTLSSYSPKTVIVDIGCGDAALAKALIPRGFTVLSFDLVGDERYVVEADTCSRIPLPGAEEGEGEVDQTKRQGEGQVVDVVVCALSLMSTNWVSCVREAWRILKSGGELKIAEVTSRFIDTGAFIDVVSSVGFKLQSKDESNTHFTLFEFTKVPRKSKSEKEWTKLISRGSVLKPCEYKRR